MARMVARCRSSRRMTSGGSGGGGPSITPGAPKPAAPRVGGAVLSADPSGPAPNRPRAADGGAAPAEGPRANGGSGRPAGSARPPAIPPSVTDGMPEPPAAALGAAGARPGSRAARRSAATRSCISNSSPASPSTTVRATIPPVATSSTLAVIRRRAPTPWYAPPRTRPTPADRPAASRLASVTAPAPDESSRTGFRTCPRTTGVAGDPRWRAAETDSAIPAPIHASPGAPLISAKGTTARGGADSTWPRASGDARQMRTTTVAVRVNAMRRVDGCSMVGSLTQRKQCRLQRRRRQSSRLTPRRRSHRRSRVAQAVVAPDAPPPWNTRCAG